MTDGSIVFDTRIDNSGAVKDLAKLKNRIKVLSNQLEIKAKLSEPLIEQSKQMAAQLDAAKAALASMKISPAGTFTSEQISAQKETVSALQSRWNALQDRVDSYRNGIKKTADEMNILKQRAGELEEILADAEINTEKLESATKRAGNGAMNFSKQLKSAMSSILLYGTLFQAYAKLVGWTHEVIKINDKASEAVGILKASFLTLVQPIMNVVIPAIIFLSNVLSRIISVVAAFLSAVTGSTLAQSAESAENLYDQSKAIREVGSAAKKASKQLASFDEINKLSGDGGGTGTGSEQVGIPADFSQDWNLDWLEKTLGKAAGWVTAALMIGGIAFIAIGAATGRLSLIIAGILMLGSGITIGTETGVIESWSQALGLENASQFIPMALVIAGIALVAIGAALGQILIVLAGLGLIGAGIAVAVGNGSAGYWADKLGLNDVFDYITAAIQLAGIALIVIGTAMGNIFMVIAGAVLLTAGLSADIIGEETLRDWWDTLKLTNVQQWVSVTLLLAGIALTAIGTATANIAMLLIGLGMIGFGTVIGTQNGNLADWVETMGLEKAAGWVTAGLLIGGIALVVFGILTANILMIFAGLGLLGAGIAIGITSGSFSAWLDTISNAFSAFADTVKGIFNSLWEGIKGVINSILGGVEGMANGVINGINFVIDALNNLKFDIPDWIPGFGGKSFGFNIPKLNQVELPRLAQGAVIPPNREFMAVLGDQKNGTNIETPLATMIEAFKQAMADTGYGAGSEAVLVIDGEVFGRLAYRLGNKEARRKGVSLVEGKI